MKYLSLILIGLCLTKCMPVIYTNSLIEIHRENKDDKMSNCCGWLAFNFSLKNNSIDKLFLNFKSINDTNIISFLNQHLTDEIIDCKCIKSSNYKKLFFIYNAKYYAVIIIDSFIMIPFCYEKVKETTQKQNIRLMIINYFPEKL